MNLRRLLGPSVGNRPSIPKSLALCDGAASEKGKHSLTTLRLDVRSGSKLYENPVDAMVSLAESPGEVMKGFVQGADRQQTTLLPECLDDWVGESNPVRAVDVFVDALELRDLGFDGVDPAATGRPAYHPSPMLKLYIYGRGSIRTRKPCVIVFDGYFRVAMVLPFRSLIELMTTPGLHATMKVMIAAEADIANRKT